MSFTTMLALLVSSMLIYSVPLIFTSVGRTFSERADVVNIGLEGIMVMGVFSGVLLDLSFADVFGNATPWVASIVVGFVGVLYSLTHAIATINFRADHVVSETILNLIAPSSAVFQCRYLFGKGQMGTISETLGRFSFPILKDIPVIGQIFSNNTSLVACVAILVSFISWFITFKIHFGLRLRSVGEHSQAADTLGINVYLMRYAGVMISGFFGGIGGAVYAQAISNNFAVITIAGPGFIALAAMIFGRWDPIDAMLSSLSFGLSQSLAIIGAQLPFPSNIPSIYLKVAPHVLTIVVLAAFFGKAATPKADGINYIKSK